MVITVAAIRFFPISLCSYNTVANCFFMSFSSMYSIPHLPASSTALLQFWQGFSAAEKLYGNTAQFPPYGSSTAPAAAAPRSPYRHLELCGIAL
jgi:hypothetical protein